MHELKRSLNFSMLTLYGLGTILGAGIYVLVGKVAIHAGLYAPISFLLAALLAGLSGYSYAALSAHLPKSAGEAVYVETAFNLRPLSILVGWMVVLTGVVSAATISKGFVGYLQVFIDIPDFWAISMLLLAMTGLAYWGVNESVWATAATTLLGLLGLMIILYYSAPSFLTLAERSHELLPPLTDGGIWFGILLGAFLAFYAFIGFEDMVNMAEEVKQPEVTLPKAIIAAIVISSILYYLIALAAVLQMPQDQLIASKAPMADIMNQHSESMAWFVSFISLAAIVNGALVQIIMGSRVMYGMGKHNMAPLWLAKIHPVRKTPYIATLLIGLVVWVLATQFPLTSLAKLTSFIIIMVFFLVNVALIKLLFTKETKDHFTAKPWVPVVGAIMCLMFLGVQVDQIISGSTVVGH